MKDMHSRTLAYPVGGVQQAAVASGIRYKNRLDLVLIELAAGSTLSGVFTRNQFQAAPVLVAKKHLLAQKQRGQQQKCYLLINTGNANAGTGTIGEQTAISCCEKLAERAGVDIEQVLPFSTGVIGEPLPLPPILHGLPTAFESLAKDAWSKAARGIMTTDTRPKLRSTRLNICGGTVHITGIAKGAGMLKPNMATMLSFICTDAALPQMALDALLHSAIDCSFNRITVDGDTSTNDACILAATGQGNVTFKNWDDKDSSGDWNKFRDAVHDIFRKLAEDLILDAEGASKFIRVTVSGGMDKDECLKTAYAVAESPLVKTACFASDPNWGRILAAIGRAGIPDLDISTVRLYLNGVPLVQGGGLHPDYTEDKGQAAMAETKIHISIHLNRGTVEESVCTSDLSHDYIRINAEYRT